MNISSIVGSTTTATGLANIVLATVQTNVGYQPQNTSNGFLGDLLQIPPSIMFHYEGEQTVSIESDITDHFIEDNTAIQDQIALRPEIITTHGYIGELNNVPPLGLSSLKSALDKLTPVGAYLPALTVAAQNAYNQAFALYQVASNATNAAVGLWSSLFGSGAQNKQQIAFQQFYGYWQSRTLFTVQTPWCIFKNCAISKLRAIQDAETNVISDFEVTFKVIRMATTATTTLQAGRLAAQASSLVSNGTSTPAPSLGVNTALSSHFPGGF